MPVSQSEGCQKDKWLTDLRIENTMNESLITQHHVAVKKIQVLIFQQKDKYVISVELIQFSNCQEYDEQISALNSYLADRL